MITVFALYFAAFFQHSAAYDKAPRPAASISIPSASNVTHGQRSQRSQRVNSNDSMNVARLLAGVALPAPTPPPPGPWDSVGTVIFVGT